MEETPLVAEQKRDVARALLERGDVYVHLDARRVGVTVPKRLRRRGDLVLHIGHDMPVPIPDLAVDDAGVRATLSFGGRPFACELPWGAVYALVGAEGKGKVWEADVPADVQRAGAGEGARAFDRGALGWKITWGAALLAAVSVAALPFVLPKNDAEPEFATALLMWAIALALAVASVVMPQRWLRSAIESLDLPVVDEVTYVEDYRTAARRRRVLHVDGRVVTRVRKAVQMPHLLSILLPFFVTALGVVLQRLGHETSLCMPLVLLGPMVIAIRYPYDGLLAAEVSRATVAELA